MGLALDVADVLRRHGYPIPRPHDDDFGRIYVEIQQALFRLVYDYTDLGSRTNELPSPPAAGTKPDHRGVER